MVFSKIDLRSPPAAELLGELAFGLVAPPGLEAAGSFLLSIFDSNVKPLFFIAFRIFDGSDKSDLESKEESSSRLLANNILAIELSALFCERLVRPADWVSRFRITEPSSVCVGNDCRWACIQAFRLGGTVFAAGRFGIKVHWLGPVTCSLTVEPGCMGLLLLTAISWPSNLS